MRATAEEIWTSAQDHLRGLLNADIYHLWFEPLQAIGFEDDVLTLQVANDFCEVWLKENYLGLIRDVLAQTSNQPLAVKFHVAPIQVPGQSAANPGEHPPSPKQEVEAPEPAVRELAFNPKNTFDNF